MLYLYVKGFSEHQLRAIGGGTRLCTADELRLWMERVIQTNLDSIIKSAKKPSGIKVKVRK